MTGFLPFIPANGARTRPYDPLMLAGRVSRLRLAHGRFSAPMFNRQSQPGWMAVALRPQQITLAHVVRGAAGSKPRLALLDSVAR